MTILGLSNSYCEFGAFCDDIRCMIVWLVLFHIFLRFACMRVTEVRIVAVCQCTLIVTRPASAKLEGSLESDYRNTGLK